MTDGERLVRVEENLKNVVTNMEKLNNNFENFTNTFVPRKELELMLNYRDKEIDNLKEDIESMEKNKWSMRRLWPAWMGVGLSAFSIGVTVFALAF